MTDYFRTYISSINLSKYVTCKKDLLKTEYLSLEP